ncbi:MAG: hypothetical protein AAGI23_09360 [Bacteroidota bacterium]
MATRRKKRVAGTSKATRKFNGKVYRRNSCSKTKTAAKAKAKRLRASGKKARVVGTCVYTRG